MRLRGRFAIFVMLSLLSGTAYTQTAAAPAQQQLKVTSRTESQAHGLPVGRVGCDDHANFYLRQFDPDSFSVQQDLAQGPVQRVNADGTLGPTFKITDVSPALSFRAFIVGGQGEVYILAQGPPNSTAKTNPKAGNIKFAQFYVIRFSGSGEVQSVIKIHRLLREFIPYQFAIFADGAILLSGVAGDYQHRPYTAVFDAAGNLIKRVSEPEDEDSRQKAEAGNPAYVDEPAKFGNNAITDGDAVTGPDGNVYLLRATSPGVVLVISSAGETVRKLTIDSPSPGFLPLSLKASANGLAVVFRKRHSRNTTIRIVDYAGNAIQAHSFDAALPADFLACYMPPAFYFTKSDVNKTLHLVRIEPN